VPNVIEIYELNNQSWQACCGCQCMLSYCNH